MDRERWKRIEELFQQGLELPPGERPAFLDQVCQDDATLRAELEALLGAHAEAGDFHGSPPCSTSPWTIG